MAEPKASVGRIVHYRLSEYDAERVNRRRQDAVTARSASGNTGFAVHVGNSASAGEDCPAVVVRAWDSDHVNLQVLLDGSDTLWVTSAAPGDELGQWHWPERTD